MAEVVPEESMVGGGSLPGGTLPTRAVAIGGGSKSSAQRISRRLRLMEVPVIGRISEDVVLLDPRSVLPEEDEYVMRALRNLAGTQK
jgi:L-seryl-tRNA(Ser) seleniumtransferase